MRKLFKRVLSLVAIAIVGMPQVSIADSNPNDDLSYSMQIKSVGYSKQTTSGLKGVVYTEPIYTDYATATNKKNWPMVEAKTNYSDYQDKFSFVANYKDFYNGTTTTNKTCYVKQFGVSMGVVYWIVPTKDVIYYWNTVTGEVGEFTPQKTYDGANYAFDGATTGYGNITQDWYGNLVHQWNNVTGADINTPARGFAIYKAPSTYGVALTSETAKPKLSDMTTCNVPYDRGTLNAAGTGVIVDSWDRMTTPNPNIPSTARQTLWGKSVGTPVAMDYMGASGDFWGGSDVWAPSTYFRGKASGYLFFAYNNLIFGQMIAEGGYANWYLNYVMRYHHYQTSINANLSTAPNSVSLDVANGHSREFMFRECDVREYFWSVPFTGLYESPGPSSTTTVYHDAICVMPRNYYSGNTYQKTDWMSAPEIDSIKGYRVLINSLNLNTEAASLTGRNGAIDINVCEYTNHDYVLSTKESPSRTYTRIGYAFAYNNEDNTNPLTGHSVNSWNELERVNNNVFALYTHVPGQGFSKYFITAVEEDNPVTYTSGSTAVEGVKVERRCYSEGTNTVPGSVDALISWNAQKYDRETLNNYEVWYRTYKRDDSGNLVTLCDDTWSLAGTSSISYADGNYYPDYADGDNVDGDYNPENAPKGSFTHKAIPYGGADTEDTSDDYDIVYEYMVIPIYSASNHRGTEAYGNTTITSSAPRIPVNGTLSQIKEGDKYSFNLKLDVETNSNLTVPFADNKVKASITKYVLVAEDEETATALSQATSVECLTSGMTVTTGQGITPVFASHNCSHYTANGYYAIVEGFSAVSASGTALPSLVWHNVNPEVEYKVKVYGVANRGYNFVGTGDIIAKMTVPGASTSMSMAEFLPLHADDDYSSMQRDEILPMGAKLRKGSDEVTNPIALKHANTLGTRGSVINPLDVTEEVLANWKVQYTYHVLQNGAVIKTSTLESSDENAALYSKDAPVIVDVLGLPIEKTDWNIYDQMNLTDAQKAVNDNITKQQYDAPATIANLFETKVDVAYTRKNNSVMVSNTNGTKSTISIDPTTPFSKLSITGESSLGALFQRKGSHFYYENAENNGYYPYYYDAGIQWVWGEYSDNLNKYIGYHAVTQTECAGHYETTSSTTWTQYYAANVLSDTQVEEYNTALEKSGITKFLSGIGYDGTQSTDWSDLASTQRKLPMNIHYVWGGSSLVATSEERSAIKMSVIITTDYPMIEGVMLKVNEYNADKDYSMMSNAVSLADDESQPVATMNMISVPTTLKNVSVDFTTTVTGVEGVITNATGGVMLYPNPVGSTFTLQAPMAMGEVKIFTMEGQLVKVVKDINDTMVSINVDELPQGMYIVNTLGIAKIMIKQ